MKTTTFIVLSFVLLLASCRKEQPAIAEVEAEEPCDCATEVSAEFDILERFGNFGGAELIFTPTDNILGDKNVKFSAREEDATYTWYIGTEVLDTKDFLRFFSAQLVNTTIPISLVVEKKPNKLCFPDDDGRDSITRYMTVFDECDTSVMEGAFRIAEENSLDSMDITIDLLDYTYASHISSPTPNDCRGINTYNYDGLGSNCLETTTTVSKGYRYIEYNGGPGYSYCDQLQTQEVCLDLNGNFYIKLFTSKHLGGTSYETKTRKMYGRKL